MKTTIEIPDALFMQAKRVALERRTSLKALIQRGLERELQAPTTAQPHPLETLKALDRSVWLDLPGDNFVKEQREGWA